MVEVHYRGSSSRKPVRAGILGVLMDNSGAVVLSGNLLHYQLVYRNLMRGFFCATLEVMGVNGYLNI